MSDFSLFPLDFVALALSFFGSVVALSFAVPFLSLFDLDKAVVSTAVFSPDASSFSSFTSSASLSPPFPDFFLLDLANAIASEGALSFSFVFLVLRGFFSLVGSTSTISPPGCVFTVSMGWPSTLLGLVWSLAVTALAFLVFGALASEGLSPASPSSPSGGSAARLLDGATIEPKCSPG